MDPDKLKDLALAYLAAKRENNPQRITELEKQLREVPYEDWQLARAVFSKKEGDENYDFRNVARVFQSEWRNTLYLKLTDELVRARRFRMLFAVGGAIAGFIATNLLRYVCTLPSWIDPLSYLRRAVCWS